MMTAIHDVLRYLLERVPHSTQEEHDQIAAVIDQDENPQTTPDAEDDENGAKTPPAKKGNRS